MVNNLHLLRFILPLVSISIFSCSSDEKPAEVLELEQQLAAARDSIAENKEWQTALENRIDLINSVIDSSEAMDEFFESEYALSKEVVVSKIRFLDSLLTNALNEADSLRKLLASQDAPPFIETGFDLKVAGLEEMKSKYVALSSVVNQLKQDKVNMKKIIKEYENELAQKDITIEDLSKTKTKLQGDIKRIQRQKESLEKEKKEAEQKLNLTKIELGKTQSQIKNSRRKRAEDLYEMGLSFKKEFDNSIIKIGGDTKKELIQKAYAYFKQAEELGHTEASKMVQLLEKNKKYSRKIRK